MKKIFSTVLFIGLLSFASQAQDIYAAKETYVKFFSESPLENIEAENTKCKSVYKKSTNTIAVVIPILNFKFEKPLMEEHFNENYMESEKYPTASFKGTVKSDADLSKDGEYKASATGTLKIHGVEKDRTLDGTITVKGKELTFDTKFQVKLVDHDIEIPTVVVKNIAEVIDVTAKFVYAPKE